MPRLLTVSDTHVALQASDGLRVEDITDHAVGLDLVEATSRTAGDDTSCVLATKMSAANHRARPDLRDPGVDSPVLKKRETLGAGSVSDCTGCVSDIDAELRQNVDCALALALDIGCAHISVPH